MSWSLYKRLTARNRAIEAAIAAFVLFWSATVLHYWLTGSAPLAWAGLPEGDQWQHPAILLAACAIHMAGIRVDQPHPWPAIARAAALGVMTATFAHLSYLGVGLSAMPTYLAMAVICGISATVPLRDARYAREVTSAT